MQLNDIKIKNPNITQKIKEEAKEEICDKSCAGFPAKTDALIGNPQEKTLIKKNAKTAKLSEKNRIIENPDKSIVGYTAKTNRISNNPEEKTIIKKSAKTAKLALE